MILKGMVHPKNVSEHSVSIYCTCPQAFLFLYDLFVFGITELIFLSYFYV